MIMMTFLNRSTNYSKNLLMTQKLIVTLLYLRAI